MTELLIGMLPKLLGNVTPELRRALRSLVDTLREKARTTPNPYDDIAVATLAVLLGFDLEG
jgi:hypothetical protein